MPIPITQDAADFNLGMKVGPVSGSDFLSENPTE
jgi:hypothetical protein